jgi:hypothetical protein
VEREGEKVPGRNLKKVNMISLWAQKAAKFSVCMVRPLGDTCGADQVQMENEVSM